MTLWSSLPARLALAGLVLAPTTVPAAGSSLAPISPGGSTKPTAIGQRCPTFSWGAAAGALAFELIVLPTESFGEREPGVGSGEPLLRVGLPGAARSYTPPLGSCLLPGDSYSWRLRERRDTGWSAWTPPRRFAVSVAPSPMQVEEALAVLRSYLRARRADSAPGAVAAAEEGLATVATRRHRSSTESSQTPAETRFDRSSLTQGGAATAPDPTTDPISLSLEHSLHLDASANVFKDGALFLWNDASDNTAVGMDALPGNTSGDGNTALGVAALLQNQTGDLNTAVGVSAANGGEDDNGNTAVGYAALADDALAASDNTAVGRQALFKNTTGEDNTAVGYDALGDNLDGSSNTAAGANALTLNQDGVRNTALGVLALGQNVSGDDNTAVGTRALWKAVSSGNIGLGEDAGMNLDDSGNNIMIGHPGVSTDANLIRIGNDSHSATYIAGIFSKTAAGGIQVYVGSDGELGTATSSRRYKREIRDVGEDSLALYELRPVAFRYRPELLDPGEGSRLEYGLIAEEVAEVLPQLVLFDPEGRPRTVRYHVLVPLLLNELQRLNRELETGDRLIARQAGRLRKLEARLETGGESAR